MRNHCDVLIIGGGIQGCAAAFHLSSAGYQVTVLEKDFPGRHASGVNAGGVRSLGRHLCELPLSLAAKRDWLDLSNLLELDVGFRAVGQLRVAENGDELERLRQRALLVDQLHLPYKEQVVGPDDLRQLAPALARHCVGGLWVGNDGHANPFKTTWAFRRAAERRGACFRLGTKAQSLLARDDAFTVTTSNGRRFHAPRLINCAGAWAGTVAEMLGDTVALHADGSMLMVTARLPHFLKPVVGAAGRSVSFKQFENGTVLIGGGHRSAVDLDTNRSSLSLDGLIRSARNAMDLFPNMRSARAVRFWSGIEAFTPDGLPVVSAASAYHGAYHAFGFSAHGFQLAPAVGRALAMLVQGYPPAVDLSAFRVDRPALRQDKQAVTH